MPKSLMNPTQLFLTERMETLRGEIAKTKLSLSNMEAELEQVENAYAATSSKKESTLKGTTFKQKILICLNDRQKVLSVNDFVSVVVEAESELGVDEINTAKSLRLAIRRLLKEDTLVEYKSYKLKNIHYGLKGWADERGLIKEEYL